MLPTSAEQTTARGYRSTTDGIQIRSADDVHIVVVVGLSRGAGDDEKTDVHDDISRQTSWHVNEGLMERERTKETVDRPKGGRKTNRANTLPYGDNPGCVDTILTLSNQSARVTRIVHIRASESIYVDISARAGVRHPNRDLYARTTLHYIYRCIRI